MSTRHGIAADHTSNIPYGRILRPVTSQPAFVIMMRPERTCEPLRRTLWLVPRLRCVRATRASDVRIVRNGTALVRNGTRTATVLYHYPHVHPTVFATRELEIAILLSHLRALALGRASGAAHFFVFEEDAEWAMLLGVQHGSLSARLAAMPRHWSVLQLAVIAELPYLKHLHRRLAHRLPSRMRRDGGAIASAALAYGGIVRRESLRGLSWPFTPGREVVDNKTWLRPYWSAAAYAVSARGAGSLLDSYWPGSPRLAGATIDTRSQLWPAADQLLYNLSGAYLSTPLLTQVCVRVCACACVRVCVCVY